MTQKIYVPLVERKNGQVLSIAGNIAQIMDMSDYSTIELTIPDEYKDVVEVGKDVQYLVAMDKMKLDIRI